MFEMVYSRLGIDFCSQTTFLLFKRSQHTDFMRTHVTSLEQLEDNFCYNFNFFGVLKLIWYLSRLFLSSGEDETCLHSWIRPWESSEFLSEII